MLFVNMVIPESELERSHQSLIRLNIELQQVRLDHSEKSIEMAEKRQLLQDYIIKRVEDKEKLVSVLNESYMNLNAQIKIWENTYLLDFSCGRYCILYQVLECKSISCKR